MGLNINFSTSKNFELNLNTTLNDEVDPSHVNTLEMQEVEEIVLKTKGNQCDYFVEEMEEDDGVHDMFNHIAIKHRHLSPN
jgi:hypothetical protein